MVKAKFWKETSKEEEVVEVPAKKSMVSDDLRCQTEGCHEPLAPGQNQVCKNHIKNH